MTIMLTLVSSQGLIVPFGTEGVNYSINVNYSDTSGDATLFEGYTPTTLKDWIETAFDSIYCELTGCTMSGNLIVNADITADNFFGNWNGSSGYVPYTGATKDVDLGVHDLKSAGTLQTGNITIGSGEANVDYTLTFNGDDNDCVITFDERGNLLDFGDTSLTTDGTVTIGAIPNPDFQLYVSGDQGTASNSPGKGFKLLSGKGLSSTDVVPAFISGVGGVYEFESGGGGDVSNTFGIGFGADGGTFKFTSGDGGSSVATAGQALGGPGGIFTFTSGDGGDASGGTVLNLGGAGADMTFDLGVGGTGATSNGADGSFIVKTGGSTRWTIDGAGDLTATGAMDITTTGDVKIQSDTAKDYFGSADDFSMGFNGTAFVFDDEVGSYNVYWKNTINANIFESTVHLQSGITDTLSSALIIDTPLQELQDSSGVDSIAWTDRYMFDSNPTKSLDYGSRTLTYSDGSTIMLDWSSAYLYDYDSGNGALDWNNRDLYANDGSDVVCNWDTVGLFDCQDSEIRTSGNVDASNASFDNLDVVGNITANEIYGEIYIHENNQSIRSFNTQDVYENVTVNQSLEYVNGFSFSDGKLIALIAGRYKILNTISFSGQTGSTHGFSIGINGVKQYHCYTQRKLGSSDVGALSVGCSIELSIGDVVTQMSADEDASLNDILIVTSNLNLKRIGN